MSQEREYGDGVVVVSGTSGSIRSIALIGTTDRRWPREFCWSSRGLTGGLASNHPTAEGRLARIARFPAPRSGVWVHISFTACTARKTARTAPATNSAVALSRCGSGSSSSGRCEGLFMPNASTGRRRCHCQASGTVTGSITDQTRRRTNPSHSVASLRQGPPNRRRDRRPGLGRTGHGCAQPDEPFASGHPRGSA